jgi:hypothetical protein
MKKRIRCMILLAVVFLVGMPVRLVAGEIGIWFPPEWKDNAQNFAQAQAIAEALSKGSGETIQPNIARTYVEILSVFSNDQPALLYAGSFVQAMIRARGQGVTLAQCVNGKEFYGGVMIYPRGQNPNAILAEFPGEIAYAVGASSGESSARAATGGKAAIKLPNHKFAAEAVKAGRAKGAFVKNWWWEANKATYPELDATSVPGVSDTKNPDNILTGTNTVSPGIRQKVLEAAIASKDVFKASEMVPFDGKALDFSLMLMKKGSIDPLTYSW